MAAWVQSQTLRTNPNNQTWGMARGPAYYPSKGACIYCGAKDRPLRDEHVVPYSLSGTHVLREASCARCEDTTKKFEQKVARDLWGDARTSFRQPTRRKKERRTHIEMPESEGQGIRLVPASEYPAGFVFYKMGPCGFLQGLPEAMDMSPSWQLVMIDDDARRDAFFRKHGHHAVLKFRHVPQDFGRMVAKIAYCQVLTALDLGEFRPLILPYITGEKRNLSYLVGSTDAVPEADNGYRLSTMYAEHGPDLILMAEVRLYANTHAPTYQVIVGDVLGTEATRRARNKLSLAQ